MATGAGALPFTPAVPGDRRVAPPRPVRADAPNVKQSVEGHAYASCAGLETHCLSITEHAPDSLSVVRFMPREDLAGPQLIGRYVVDQRTGRLHSDTLDYLRPPKGAPGQARMVGRYAEGAELLAVPLRIVETISPSELRVSLDGRRLRVVRTERTLTRLWPSAPPPGDNGRQPLWREGGEHRARRPLALVPPASRLLTASTLLPPLPRRPTAHPA